MSRARDVSKTIDDYARVALEQDGKITRRTRVQNEELSVYWDKDLLVNFVRTLAEPLGDVISIVVDTKTESLPIDGRFNQAGNRVDFLKDTNLSGSTAFIKYLRSV